MTASVFRYKHSVTGDERLVADIEITVVMTKRGVLTQNPRKLSWAVAALCEPPVLPGVERMLYTFFDKLPEMIAKRERVVLNLDKGSIESWPPLS